MRARLVPLSKVCKQDRQSIRTGLRPELRYVGMESVEAHTGQLVSGDLSKTPEAPEANSFHFDSSHVLYGKLRPYLNKVYAPDVEGKCSTELIPLRPNDELDRHYLAYFLRAPSSVEAISQKVAGARMPRADMSFVMSMPIPLPTVAEQRCVVDLLSRAEGIVRMRREAEAKAKEIIPALFVDKFGDSGLVRGGDQGESRREAVYVRSWTSTTLAESGASIRYGIGQPLPQIEKGVPFVRATNVKHGRISREGLVFVDPAANPVSRNPPLSASDILVVRSGAYTGDVAQVGDEFEGAIAGYDLVVRPAESQTAEFLSTYLLLPQVQQTYIRGNTIRAAQPHLNAKQLGEVPVPIVPMQEQRKFREVHRRARGIEGMQVEARERAEQTFKSLLAGVFGEGK